MRLRLAQAIAALLGAYVGALLPFLVGLALPRSAGRWLARTDFMFAAGTLAFPMIAVFELFGAILGAVCLVIAVRRFARPNAS